jgi:hypothetical protein
MRTRHLTRLAAATLLAVLAGGCGSLSARYSSAELKRVGSQLNTGDSIYAELGIPDLRREDARIWIYAWEDALPEPSLSLLVLEFDADGRLVNKELSRGAKPAQGGLDAYSPGARYCSSGGTCIEHGMSTDEGLKFDDSFSAVTVKGAAQQRIRPPEPGAEECLLLLWPGKVWRASRGSILPPDGVAVSVAGASKWPYYRWLPTGAFARIVLTAGEHVVSVRDPVWDERMSDRSTEPGGFWPGVVDALLRPPSEEYDLPPSTATVQCRAGERVYLEIDAAFKSKGGHWFPIVLNTVDAATAQALIANMAQVLPPDY